MCIRDSCHIGRKVCEGLDAALAHGLIHRDIKPANIIINESDDLVKIVDLGLARRMGVDDERTSVGSAVLGTPKYMSPEQALDPNSVDFRSDIYSLGVTLFSCLAGRAPYDADSPSEIILKHINAPVPSLNEFAPDLPRPLATLIGQMMSKKPEDRPDGYRLLAAEFGRLYDRFSGESDGSSSIIKSWIRRLT